MCATNNEQRTQKLARWDFRLVCMHQQWIIAFVEWQDAVVSMWTSSLMGFIIGEKEGIGLGYYECTKYHIDMRVHKLEYSMWSIHYKLPHARKHVLLYPNTLSESYAYIIFPIQFIPDPINCDMYCKIFRVAQRTNASIGCSRLCKLFILELVSADLTGINQRAEKWRQHHR